MEEQQQMRWSRRRNHRQLPKAGCNCKVLQNKHYKICCQRKDGENTQKLHVSIANSVLHLLLIRNLYPLKKSIHPQATQMILSYISLAVPSMISPDLITIVSDYLLHVFLDLLFVFSVGCRQRTVQLLLPNSNHVEQL